MQLSHELTLIAQFYERHITSDFDATVVLTAPAILVLAGQFHEYAERAAELEEKERQVSELEAIATDLDVMSLALMRRAAGVGLSAVAGGNVVAFPGRATPSHGGAA